MSVPIDDEDNERGWDFPDECDFNAPEPEYSVPENEFPPRRPAGAD